MERRYVVLGATAALIAGILLGGSLVHLLKGSAPQLAISPAPACTLSASPKRVLAGRSVTLTWTLKNVATATIDQGVGPVFSISGDVATLEKLVRVVNPTATTTFTMTVKNRSGEASCSDTVTVNVPRPAAARPPALAPAPPAAPPAVTPAPAAPAPAPATVTNRPVGVGLDADRYVGVLWIKETPKTRQMMAGLTGSQRFAQLYGAIRPDAPASDRIEGVGPGQNGSVPMTIRSGTIVHWSGMGTIERGIARVKVPSGTRIPSTAALCAVFPTALGYHQVSPRADLVAPGEEGRMACLDGRVYDYFINQGRGKTPGDGLAVLGFERS